MGIVRVRIFQSYPILVCQRNGRGCCSQGEKTKSLNTTQEMNFDHNYGTKNTLRLLIFCLYFFSY